MEDSKNGEKYMKERLSMKQLIMWKKGKNNRINLLNTDFQAA